MIEDRERYEAWCNFKKVPHWQNLEQAFDYAWIKSNESKDAIIAKQNEQIAEYEKVIELWGIESRQVLKKWANESEVEK